MELQGRNLTFELRGADVRLLQFELRLLVLDISDEEVLENHFGEGTRQAVRIFQREFGLHSTGIVEGGTARRINAAVRERVPVDKVLDRLTDAIKQTLEQIDALEPDQPDMREQIARNEDAWHAFTIVVGNLHERDASDLRLAEIEEILEAGRARLRALADGLNDNDATFSVSGRIIQRDGAPIVGVRVRALEKRVVSAQNRVLGEVRSSDSGGYAVRYGMEGEAGADLLVEVLAPEGDAVITRSPLIVDAAPHQTVDLVVDNAAYPSASEFAQIEARLRPWADDGSLDQLDSDSVGYLSGRTDISPVRLSAYLQARRFAQHGEVPAQVYYGLFRANLPVNKPALVAQDNALLVQAIEDTSSANVIDPALAQQPETIERAVGALNRELVDTIIAQPTLPSGEASLGAFLEIAALDDVQKRTVVQQVQSTTSRGADFWTGLAEQGVEPQAVESLKLTAQLGTLTLNNAPLMGTLHARLADRIGNGQEPLRALVGMTQDDWLSLVRDHTNGHGDVIVPDALSAVDNQAPEMAYARTMTRVVEDAYPTPTLVARAGANGFAGAALLHDFLAEHGDFEYRNTSVPSYLRAHELNLDGETQQTLERIGRVFALAPHFEREQVVQPLLEAGIHSAYQIRSMGERRFVGQFSEAMGEAGAKEVYASAAQKTATATVLFAQQAPIVNNVELAAIPLRDVASTFGTIPNLPMDYIDFPTWEELFGNLDFCACEHCKSVYSPAAYLVALLKFLRDRGALDDLTARRLDIGHIELNCHNTNTTLPYVDLVLEVLETFLVEGGNVQREDVFQTEGEAPALRVHPEHINAEAYRILAEERVYPWSLPFSLWAEESRAYLGPLGVARDELLDHFNPIPAQERDVNDWLPVASERLNLTPDLRTILLHNAFRAELWNGRILNALRTVQTLLDTARISFLELRQLLGTRFVNPDGMLELTFAVGEDDDAEIICDLEQATIEDLTGAQLNRLQRFVRLRRALGWSTHELDAVLHALGGNLDEATLVALASAQTLHARLKTPLLVIAGWVADVDTHDYLTDEDETARSFYATLFLNRTVGGDEELAPFALDAFDGLVSLDDHEAAILAALQIITAEELALIRERRLTDNALTLANLSELHRVATLKRALKLTVKALLDLLDLSGLNPFDTATLSDGEQLVDLVQTLDDADFSVAELNYLLRHRIDANSTVAPTGPQIGFFLEGLRTGLQRVRTHFAAAPDPTGELTAQMLAILLADDALSSTLALLYGIAPAADLPADPPAFLDEQLALFIPDAAARDSIVTQLLNEGDASYLQPEMQQAERFALALAPLAAHLSALNSTTLVLQRFADFLALGLDASGMVLGKQIHSVANPVDPASALFLSDVFVQSENEISADAFADQYAMVYRLHKVALLIERLELPTEELAWLVDEHATVEWLDLNALPVVETADAGVRWAEWLHMARASVLRNAWPAGEPTLFALLRQAETGGDAAAFNAFLSALSERIGWNRADLDALLHATRFDLDDFDADWGGAATLEQLWRLHEAFGLLRRLGVSASMAWGWTAAPVTRAISGEVKQAARAKSSESAWLNVAERIRDRLRQRQRDALVDAVIQQLNDPLIQDTNDLYARFLMDSEMNPCMLTSRIVFATAAVQLFVQRIFLNLEDDVRFSTEDAALWQWMKNYRLWEANVKVFVTPENWIEPELRPEKSPAFIDLENELLQNDVTLESVEIAYENYLEKLDEVGRLEVLGLYNEDETNTLHVIARTEGTPHKYFYRQWVEARRWTPWKEVPVDIEGETVQPVIYNRRLYLFWFTTIVKAEEEVGEKAEKPKRHLEIKLAWSQYRHRKWSPKRMSDDVVETNWEIDETRSEDHITLQSAAYRPRPVIQSNGDLLIVVERTLRDSKSYLDTTRLKRPSNFLFINDGQVELVDYSNGSDTIESPLDRANIWSYYATTIGGSPLSLRGYNDSWQKVLNNAPDPYRVTLPLQYTNYQSTGPFFFADRNHSYFVTPRHFFGLSFAGEQVLAFPDVGVFLTEEIPLQVPDILGPLLPSNAIGPRKIHSSLESVLHPETRTPAIDVLTTDAMGAIDERVVSGQPLTVVHGGQAIIGGDVGVPMVGPNRQTALARLLAHPEQAASLMAVAQPQVGDAATRSMAATNYAEELYVADAMMTLGVADSVWAVSQQAYKRTEYTFYSFYHPYVDVLIKQLNRHGVEGILNPRENPREKGEAHELRRQLMHEPDNEQFDSNYVLARIVHG